MARHVVHRVFSGTCLCGHSHLDHHGSLICNPDVEDLDGYGRVPGSCEFFGFNEDEALDDFRDYHCGSYVDVDDPDPVRKAEWRGTRSPERTFRYRLRKWYRLLAGLLDR